MAKMQLTNFTSPRGAFIYPHLVEPDTRFNADGEYNVKLAVDEEGRDAFVEVLQPVLDAFVELGESKGKKIKPATLKKATTADLFEEECDDEGEETGRFIFKFKLAAHVKTATGKEWDQQPKLFDGAAKPITEKLNIWSGTEGKISGEIMPYFMESTKTFGLSLRVNAAQILNLVSGKGADASDYGFGEEDGGFTSEASDAGFEDETGGDDEF